MLKNKVIKESIKYEGEFLKFVFIDWINKKGENSTWEAISSTEENSEIVSIVPILIPSKRYVVIKNYRPPVDNYVLEFPAGMVNLGESIEKSALRELKEETGYIGKVVKISPPTLSSSGLSNESVIMVVVEIDENLLENKNPKQNLESDEDIDVWLVRESDMKLFVENEIKNGTLLSGRFAAYFLGKNQI